MSTLVSHPTGNANLRAVLRGLVGVGALGEFWTTIGIPPGLTASPFLLHDKVRRRLEQRTFVEAPWRKTNIRPFREATRLFARGLSIGFLNRHESGWASTDGVYQALDRSVAKRLRTPTCKVTAVYAYEDGAHDTFIAARDTGRVCIYDLPIAHWKTVRRLLNEEAERVPEWAPTMDGLGDSPAKYARKDAEIWLADHVVVASTFTQQSLRAEFPDLAVHVTPYGCPSPMVSRPRQRLPDEPIKLFYAGHLAQRKGFADLIVALEGLDINWRLTLAGPRPLEPPAALDRFLANPRCHWLGTVPHATLLDEMTKAHVFVFPSIVEGFGMVITEALASGLPVVTTPHTAGPDIMTDGHEGFIVPIRAPEMIAERITQLADDENFRYAMATNALETARCLSWAQYERQIAGLVNRWLA